MKKKNPVPVVLVPFKHTDFLCISLLKLTVLTCNSLVCTYLDLDGMLDETNCFLFVSLVCIHGTRPVVMHFRGINYVFYHEGVC